MSDNPLAGFCAAIRDPLTGKVYAGNTHAVIYESLEGEPQELRRRICKEYSHQTENTGFIDANGVFHSRVEAMKKWGIFTSQDLARKQKEAKG